MIWPFIYPTPSLFEDCSFSYMVIRDKLLPYIDLICYLVSDHPLLVSVMLDGAKSMPDLSIGRSQSVKTDAPVTPYMPMAGEGKKKKGFFSFLKKDKKFTVVS